MKKIAALILMAAAISCSSNKDYKKAEDAQDAGRQFIRASLDGDYKKARFYLLNDPSNQVLIDKQQANYQQLTEDQKYEYRNADIHPISIKSESDSITSYTYYQTSNVKDTTTIRIVHINGDWLVDLKSAFKM
jgi:hypothetical protein